ncbi:hypothetical protein PoB_005857500 [Plakobranchus ocellatus]|uniref:Uncharacterized protein n=1 Tax=Plakobranchus ocellatus TaxID=259542 RepID=A0AAV4CKD6_9GAST|nr:hypothetical protein PoB_005857500 [Plakobranchus ocellatus]
MVTVERCQDDVDFMAILLDSVPPTISISKRKYMNITIPLVNEVDSRLDGKLFNFFCLKAKARLWEALIRDMIFAEDAGVAAQTQEGQSLLRNCFCKAYRDFGLTFPASLPISKNAPCTGLAMAIWRKGESQRISCMESCHLGEAKH